jgi:threonine/homoserine/homoserine lactone efflux protein
MPMTFIPDWPVLAAFALTSLFLFITPGPDMSFMLAKTLAGGRRHGIAAVFGTNFGVLFHTTLAVVGLSTLLAASATAFTVLKIVGALYLGWMAWDAIRNGSSLAVREGEPATDGAARTFWLGLLVNLTNPKVVLFFVTFLPQFISVDDPQAAAKLGFLGVMYSVVSVPLGIGMVLVAERLVRVLKARPNVLRVIDYVFGALFAAFAVKILFTQTAAR